MGMTGGSTICSKHDDILRDAYSIQDSASGASKTSTQEELMEIISHMEGMARDISTTAEQAKQDGQAMEDGLTRKRDHIQDIEKDYEKLEKELSALEGERDELQAKIDELQNQIDNL